MAEWEQLPEESSMWYERFYAYMMAPKRSVLATYNNERKRIADQKGKKYKPAQSPPSSWSNASHKYRWQERADAFYAHQQQLEIEKYQEERLKAKNARVQVVKATTAILGKVLAKYVDRPGQPAVPPPDEKELRILADAMSKILDQNRVEFGEPTSFANVDVTSGGDKIEAAPSVDDLAGLFQKIRDMEKTQKTEK